MQGHLRKADRSQNTRTWKCVKPADVGVSRVEEDLRSAQSVNQIESLYPLEGAKHTTVMATAGRLASGLR